MAKAPIVGGDVSGRGALLGRDPGGLSLEVADLVLADVGGAIAGLAYSAARLTAAAFRTPIDRRAPTDIGAAEIVAEDVHVDIGGIALDAGRLVLARGGHVEANRRIIAPAVDIEQLHFEIADVSALGGGAEAAAAATANTPPDAAADTGSAIPAGDAAVAEPGDTAANGAADDDAAAETAGPLGINFAFLDALEGHLNVDLFADVTVPVIGRRRTTHRFRVSIDGGTIDYRALENDLSWLEDAFINFKVDGNRLVLEQDVPLIPFGGKALLSWKLSPDEVDLARNRRVRLRTLVDYELPTDDRKGKPKKSKVTLHSLGFQGVDIGLTAAAPVEVEIGDHAHFRCGNGGRPSLLGLSARGDLRYTAHGPVDPTVAAAELHSLCARSGWVRAGAIRVAAEDVDIGPAEEITLAFEGLKPRRLIGTISRVSARNLCIDLGAGSTPPSA